MAQHHMQSDWRHRSRSPDNSSYDNPRPRHRSRSPQPRRHSRHSGRSDPQRQSKKLHLPPYVDNSGQTVSLPFQAKSLSKRDLTRYKHLFASYLDIQKRIDFEELSEAEVKGRWKSFVGKWNRGILAEGWYDPATLVKAQDVAASRSETNLDVEHSHQPSYESSQNGNRDNELEPDSDRSVGDDYGPVLPHTKNTPNSKSARGPTIPNSSDLTLRDELERDDRSAAQETLHLQRQADRKLQRERLEELQPRAEAGTRERQLEKKRDAAASNRAFAESHAKGAGGELVDFTDKDLIGEEGGTEDVKRMRQREERKKNEREIRREEVLRARAAERAERLAGLKEKEDQTMSMLKAIAKERFG